MHEKVALAESIEGRGRGFLVGCLERQGVLKETQKKRC